MSKNLPVQTTGRWVEPSKKPKIKLNTFDRMIGYFSPRALLKRKKARLYNDFLERKYDAADGGPASWADTGYQTGCFLFLVKKASSLFASEERIRECYDVPFPENDLKLGPLESEALQDLLDIFRFVLLRNEYSARSWLLSEAIIRSSTSHYAAFEYRKSFINKVADEEISVEGRKCL